MTVFAFALACAGSRSVGPAEPVGPVVMEPAKAERMESGEVCFFDSKEQPLAGGEVWMRTVLGPLAVETMTSDARGCVGLAGLVEGLYQPGVRFQPLDVGTVFLRDGDVVRLQAGESHATYAAPASLSKTLDDMAAWAGFSPAEREAQVDAALRAPRGSTLRLAGLLASLSLERWVSRGGELEVSRPSAAAARELLETLPPQSPLLTAWPSGPIGAAMVLGKSPLEVPLVAAIVEQHPEPGVAAAILRIEMERAEQAGHIDRAKRLHRRIAYGPYESTPSWAEATINFPQLSSGPTAGGAAPDVVVTAADGEKGPLVASDRPTIVYAWSSYCGPCKQGPAHLRDLADAYGDRLAIVSLSIDDEAASAETFRQEHGGMPGLVLDGAQNPGLVEDLGILGVPDIMIFDDGKTLLRGRDWPKIEQTLEQVLGAE